MRILLAGFGIVGQAFVRLLHEQAADLYTRYGLTPRFVGVVDGHGAAVSETGLAADALLTAKQLHGTVAAVPDHGTRHAELESLIEDTDADVFVLATPSRLSAPAPAVDALKASLRSGLHVVSVNKAPLAVALPALRELARYNRRELRFSGTVGAATPVLAWARACARGDRIERVRAILNGTTNYILWRMHTQGTPFADALAEAQQKGYAETDPSTDIDGIDTATKVVILANEVLGRPVQLSDVQVEGIRGLPLERVQAAQQRGQVIKLVGEIDGGVRVGPQEIPAGSPLDVPASVNAVTLSLATSGDVTLVGRGAGGPETATAIVRDLLDIWATMGTQS